MIKLSIKERREQFQFFLALFIFVVGVLSFCIFYSSKSRYQISKTELEQQINENQAFEDVVKETMKTVDTTYTKIVNYDPNVQAVFLKTDIMSALNAVKSAYDRKAYDSRYKIFVQTSQLYTMLFYNKQELKRNVREDLEQIKKSFEDCVISKRQLQQTLSAQ
jgi:hypothetical protein